MTLSRQIESCKDRYYGELERAQRSKSMDVTAWVEWMLEQMSLASEFASRTIDSAIQRIRFQAVMSTVSLNERQHKTMKKLLDAGPKGYPGGMTTRKHEQISQTSTPTAARDLIELERLGLLKNTVPGARRAITQRLKGGLKTPPTWSLRVASRTRFLVESVVLPQPPKCHPISFLRISSPLAWSSLQRMAPQKVEHPLACQRAVLLKIAVPRAVDQL